MSDSLLNYRGTFLQEVVQLNAIKYFRYGRNINGLIFLFQYV